MKYQNCQKKKKLNDKLIDKGFKYEEIKHNSTHKNKQILNKN